MTKESSGQTTAVQVALRIRPLTERDRAQPRFANLANDDVIKIHENTVQVVPQNKLFTFDHVFGTNSTQNEIFSALGEKLIRKFVEGYNITILAYGQTSSGKTYTMGTAADGGHNTSDEGIVPRSMALLFDLLHSNNNDSAATRPISPTSSVSSSTSASNKSTSRLRPKSRIATSRNSHIPQVPNSSNNNAAQKTKFTVKVSFIEIYNEDLHDLLNSAPIDELPSITIREDTKGRIYWTGVKEVIVHSTDDVLYYLEQGTQNRATGSTDMNEKSSRSHAIFSVSLKQEKWIPSSTNSAEKRRPTTSMSNGRASITPNTSRLLTGGTIAQQEDGEWLITTSKFHFVDLAGSERLKRTAAEGDRRKEGININAGLLALGNVISALGDPSKKNKIHVPYRDSKLTRLLQDSLGGSATTLMIACASPVECNLAETLNTLQYANRARNIKNKSEKNQVEEWMTTENIELLRSLIGKLKHELTYLKSNTSPTTIAELKDDDDNDDEEESYYHDQRMLIADLQRQVEELDGEASVTRERNRIVEKELQRVRFLESMMQQNKEEKQVDFQHLVEPVIEEYEKSISKLESQLALTRAALNHSDMGFAEQQNKSLQLETLIRSQEQIIGELRLRLGKVLEREQSNECYIHELEAKLMKSANETTKDQEMLNELKNRIMKFKETDENTEQYIHSLEQRLASGDAERSRLRTCVEDLEAKIEAKERINVELLKRLSKSISDTSTEKLILKELDEVNAKYANLEKERDSFQEQIKSFQKENNRISTSSTLTDTNAINTNSNGNTTLEDEMKSKSNSPPSFNNLKSFANETETPSSVAALTLLQSESRAKEEAERANRLQLTLDRLEYDHQETLKELDEVLQRYHETLEQLDFFERDSSTTAHEEDLSMSPKSLDLSKEIAQAKEDAHEQEKQAFITQIANLKQALSKQKSDMESDMSNLVQKLKHELAVANKQVYILKQMESEHNATAEVEKSLQNLDTPPVVEKGDKNDDLLELEKKQTNHWKVAHGELKQDMEKMTLDLDEKEHYIAQLKQQVDDSTTRQGELQISLDESNQQATCSQKRLAETLASLTVLKIAHDGLQKKQAFDTDLAAKYNQERESLLDKHQTELANVQQTMEKIDQVLKNTTLDKETALEKIVALETQIKEQTEKAQNDNYMQQEKIIQDHEARVSALTQEFEAQSNDLKEKMGSLETELELSKNIHEETLLIHNQRLREATTQHLDVVHNLEEQIYKLQTELTCHEDSLHQVQSELETIQSKNKRLVSSHGDVNSQHDKTAQQLSALNVELNNLKNLHVEHLGELNQEHQTALEDLKSEYEKVTSSHDTRLREINSQHKETAEKMAVLQKELNNLNIVHAEQLDKLNAKHKTALNNMTFENERLSSSINILQQANSQQSESVQHMSALQLEINDLKKLHQKELETTKSRHDSNIREIKSRHADQLEKLNLQHDDELQTIQTEHEKLYSSLESELDVTELQVAELESQLDAAKTVQEQLEKGHTGFTEKIVSLESGLITAKADHVTLAQGHQAQLAEALSQHEQAILALKLAHSEQVKEIQGKHTEARTEFTEKLSKAHHDHQSTVKKLTQDLELARTTHSEKEETIYHQRQMIEKNLLKNNDSSSEQQRLYQDRITQLEQQIKQIGEENVEYTSLAEELEKEIHRMTVEKEALAEDLDISEENVHLYQEKMNDIKSTLGVMLDEQVVTKIKELVINKMSKKEAKETQKNDQSYVNTNNDILNKKQGGLGAISQQQGPSNFVNTNAKELQRQQQAEDELKKKLQNYQNQMKNMVSRDELESMEKQLMDEQQKLEKSEKTKKLLEKQLDELLKKKSTFMCF